MRPEVNPRRRYFTAQQRNGVNCCVVLRQPKVIKSSFSFVFTRFLQLFNDQSCKTHSCSVCPSRQSPMTSENCQHQFFEMHRSKSIVEERGTEACHLKLPCRKSGPHRVLSLTSRFFVQRFNLVCHTSVVRNFRTNREHIFDKH